MHIVHDLDANAASRYGTQKNYSSMYRTHSDS
jgi:hypothetical protein